MAIDTVAKRASALGFAFVATLLIPPDGAIGQGDRQTALHLYSGIAAGAPVVTPDIASFIVAVEGGAGSVALRAGRMTVTVEQ